jgi:hypothetical protein
MTKKSLTPTIITSFGSILLNLIRAIEKPIVQKLKNLQRGRQQDKRDGYIRFESEPLSLKGRTSAIARSLTRPPAAAIYAENPLLSLPWEIRETIWYLAIGGTAILWKVEDRRLKGFRYSMECLGHNDEDRIRETYIMGRWLDTEITESGAFGLLLACRRTCVENSILIFT